MKRELLSKKNFKIKIKKSKMTTPYSITLNDQQADAAFLLFLIKMNVDV